MGTRTLGSTSSPGTTHFVFFSSGSGVAFKAEGNPQTTPEEMYIDAIYVWASTHTGARQIKHALYGTGGSLLAQTSNFHSYGTTASWTHSEFSPGSFAHIATAQHIVAAVLAATDLEVYGNGSSSGRDIKQHNGSTFPSPWSTSSDVPGEGDLSWYITYFPVAQVTAIPSTPVPLGQTFVITGRSFSAGVSGITVNGAALSTWTVDSDTQITATLPTSGVSSGPVVVTTNAGVATSGSNLQIGSIYVDTSTAFQAIQAFIDNGTTWQAVAVYIDNGTTWQQLY